MDGSACAWKPETGVEDGRYARIPYRPGWPGKCHDCAAPAGGLHHPGCDAERRPRCLGQAIGCGCRWEGDAAALDGDERYIEPESPQAVRLPA
jgi:hypothetical protein